MTTLLYRVCLFLAALGFAAGTDWNSNCPTSMKPCKNGHCLPEKWFCDGQKDCPDGEDESPTECQGVSETLIHLPGDFAPPNPFEFYNVPVQCPPNQVLCNNNCLDESIRCNGYRDCANFDDEKNCLQAVVKPIYSLDPSSTNEATSGCSDGEIQCFKGNCIRTEDLCDGKNDCVHGEDEFACAFSNNKEFTYKCIEKCVGLPKNCTSDEVKAPTFPTIRPTTTTRPPRMICEPNLKLVGNYCLQVSIFPPKTWKEARESCASINTRLLEIPTGNHFLQLQNFLNQSNYKAYSFWTSANDIQNEGRWIWNESGVETHVGTPLWSIAREGNSYEQQPTGDREENCGVLENCPFRYLNDEDCNREFPFICQKLATMKPY